MKIIITSSSSYHDHHKLFVMLWYIMIPEELYIQWRDLNQICFSHLVWGRIMVHKQIFVELEKVEKENTLNSGRPRGDSHKLWNITWSCLLLVITLRPEKNCGKCHKNYLRLFFNETEIACSGVLNYPNYPFEQWLHYKPYWFSVTRFENLKNYLPIFVACLLATTFSTNW